MPMPRNQRSRAGSSATPPAPINAIGRKQSSARRSSADQAWLGPRMRVIVPPPGSRLGQCAIRAPHGHPCPNWCRPSSRRRCGADSNLRPCARATRPAPSEATAQARPSVFQIQRNPSPVLRLPFPATRSPACCASAAVSHPCQPGPRRLVDFTMSVNMNVLATRTEPTA